MDPETEGMLTTNHCCLLFSDLTSYLSGRSLHTVTRLFVVYPAIIGPPFTFEASLFTFLCDMSFVRHCFRPNNISRTNQQHEHGD